jgi:hypothetical protein
VTDSKPVKWECSLCFHRYAEEPSEREVTEHIGNAHPVYLESLLKDWCRRNEAKFRQAADPS